MTIREYIERKNALTLEQTGIVLVPEDQIIDMEPMELSFTNRDAMACPYCTKWVASQNDCDGCPMQEAGNECAGAVGNTYDQIVESLGNSLINSLEGLEELIEEYNKSNGFLN